MYRIHLNHINRYLDLTAFYQDSHTVVIANNPFYSTSNAKIKGIIGHTLDGELLVELEYSPEVVKKDELTFFRINLFDSDSNDRTRHVDCDLILRKSGTELFKASKQYGEPLFRSPNAILQTSFGFNYTGRYTLSAEDVRWGVLDPYFQLKKSSIKYKFM